MEIARLLNPKGHYVFKIQACLITLHMYLQLESRFKRIIIGSDCIYNFHNYQSPSTGWYFPFLSLSFLLPTRWVLGSLDMKALVTLCTKFWNQIIIQIHQTIFWPRSFLKATIDPSPRITSVLSYTQPIFHNTLFGIALVPFLPRRKGAPFGPNV